MKSLSSFLVISIFMAGQAFAATPNRARPGSIAGVLVSKSAPVGANYMSSQSSVRYSPENGNPLQQVTLPDGSIGYVDNANGNKFQYDQDGNLVRLPTDPDDVIITSLGVTVGTARRACQSVYADAHQAVFDETSLECLIPVVAHNWSGVIKKDGADIAAWIPMGSMMRCDADSFENISALRRSSQWVVPVMVAGGTGIGAGIGAVIDSNQNKKAAELGDKLMTGLSAEQVNLLIIEYHSKLADCMRQNFKDMVSTYVDDNPKLGRIKITEASNQRCEDHNSGSTVQYCHYDIQHKSVRDWADCNERSPGWRKTYTKFFPSDGGCYYRDEITKNSSMTGGRTYANTAASEDTTVSFDKHRFDIINWYRNLSLDSLPDSPAKTDILALQSKLQNFKTSSSQNPVAGNTPTFDTMNHFSVWGINNAKFGDIVSANENPQCELFDTGGAANTVEKLNQAYGAASALGENGLAKQLATTINIDSEFKEKSNEIEKTFGKDRKFMDTATGRGTAIGAGTGAVVGLGYWFAEGASVYCNVGGFEQVKLNRSYSIPTFRDYLIKNNYVK